jgi:hypothetical protein
MKKLVLAFCLTLTSMAAHADVIKCSFTEPFLDSIYSMTQSTLTYKGVDLPTKVYKHVSFQIKSAGVFQLVAKSGKVLQTLTLNNKGSDGMSDIQFPYEVKDNTLLSGANGGVGGCSSNQLKSKETDGDGT